MDKEITPDHLIFHQKLLDLKPKFQFGDEVVFKTGMIGTGKIIGIMPGIYYFQAHGCAKKWPKIDEKWQDKFVYYVAFPEPQKAISLEEYKEMNENYKDEVLEEWYEKLPLASSIAVIEQDISLFEF
jgi:hypothetical protein